MLRAAGADYFNPDEVAQSLRRADPGLEVTAANAAAWEAGRRRLQRAIENRLTWAFETTLGGRTIPGMLAQAAAAGLEVRIWYVGLEGPGLHVARVRARVLAGGHDIPEAKIRERYDASRVNLIRLMPDLTELKVFDNSAEGDPKAGKQPSPVLLLHLVRGVVEFHCNLAQVPAWAKPVLAAALVDRSNR
jgi:predicted ABC-type ATPase